MSTSRKILVAVAGIAIALLVTGLVLLRGNLQTVLLKTELENKYKEVAVNNFNAVDFSANWIVSIKQGREYKVELAVEGSPTIKPKLENIDGTLYFTVEGTYETENMGSLRAKVTASSLRTISARQGTSIHLKNFKSDSLWVILEDSGAFIGEENQFIYTSFKTSGNVLLQIIDDPYK